MSTKDFHDRLAKRHLPEDDEYYQHHPYSDAMVVDMTTKRFHNFLEKMRLLRDDGYYLHHQ